MSTRAGVSWAPGDLGIVLGLLAGLLLFVAYATGLLQ